MAGKNPFEAMMAQEGSFDERPHPNAKKGKGGGFMKAFQNAKKKPKRKGKK